MHHTAGRYENAVREMDAILQLRHTGYKRLGFRKLFVVMDRGYYRKEVFEAFYVNFLKIGNFSF